MGGRVPRVLVAAEQRPWLDGSKFLGRQQLSAFRGLPEVADVTVLAREATPESDGVAILSGAASLPVSLSARRPLAALLAVRRAVAKADVVAVYCPGALGALTGLAALAARRPVVAVVVGDGRAVTDAIAPEMGHRRLAFLALHRVSRFVAGRASVLRYVTLTHLQEVYPPGQSARVHAATDVSLLPRSASRGPRKADALNPWRLLVVGTLDRPYKGIDDAIRAVARLQSIGMPVSLTVVGDGRLRDELEVLAAERCLPGSVKFCGGVFGDRLEALMASHDVFVQASHTEGLSRVLLEAVGAGMALVATDVGGTREVVAASALFSPRDPEQLARCLEETLSNTTSRDAATRLTERLVSDAVDRQAQVHPRFLDDIISLGRRRRVVAHVFGVMDRGGAELRTLELMEALRADIEAHYITLRDRPGVLDERVIDAGGAIHRIPLGPSFPWKFFRCLRSIRADVLDSHVATFSGALVMLARAAGVRRRVAHFRSDGDDHGRSIRRRAQRTLMRTLIDHHSTDIVGVSPSSLSLGYGSSWSKDPRAVVIPNGVAVGEAPGASSLRDDLRIPASALLIMHVGRPSPEKNRARLPGVLAEIRRTRAAHLVLVGGTGADATALDTAIDAVGLAGVIHHVGSVDAVRTLMGQADVVVQPSLREGLPGVVLEALSVGTPVVSSDVPGSLWLAEQLEGVVTVPLSASDAQWSRAVLDAAGTSSRRQSLQASFAVSEFALDRAVARHLRLYEAP